MSILPTREEMELSKNMLRDLEGLLVVFLKNAHELGDAPKYKNLPESVKVGMLMVSVATLAHSTAKSDPIIWERTKQYVEDMARAKGVNINNQT